MSQSSKNPKRKLPKDITEQPDDQVIEKLFGKRALRELKKATGKDVEDRPDSVSVEER